MYICDLPLSIVYVRALLSRLAAREIYAISPLACSTRVARDQPIRAGLGWHLERVGGGAHFFS